MSKKTPKTSESSNEKAISKHLARIALIIEIMVGVISIADVFDNRCTEAASRRPAQEFDTG